MELRAPPDCIEHAHPLCTTYCQDQLHASAGAWASAEGPLGRPKPADRDWSAHDFQPFVPAGIAQAAPVR